MAEQTAFLHVDVDNLWAIAECYGARIPAEYESFVYDDALPRFAKLLDEFAIRATFFIVGRDLESPRNVARLRALSDAGHRFANHSYSHALRFRAMGEEEIEWEVARAEELLRERLGHAPRGFRAPGYGLSPALLRVLARRGYRYDSSLMPSPYGFVFRFLDARMRQPPAPDAPRRAAAQKTQYSKLGEARAPLRPYPADACSPLRPRPGSPLWELPAAASPLLRLPFQAGVCLRLGQTYFRAQLAAFRRCRDLPLLFLMHGADLADLGQVPHPLFRDSAFFRAPAERKYGILRDFLRQIQESHRFVTSEQWLEPGGGADQEFRNS